MKCYVLDGDEPIEATQEEWNKFFCSTERILACNMIGNVRVSTVFIGIDLSYELLTKTHRPTLWETMIFGGEHDGYQQRYKSAKDARKGHRKAMDLVLGQPDA